MPLTDRKTYCYSVLREQLSVKKRSGDDSEVDTPVPIPNTEVKHFSGDDSWACPCENSTLLVLFLLIDYIESLY